MPWPWRPEAPVRMESEHIEDHPYQGEHIGVLLLAVRNDAGGTLVDASGDYTPIQVDAQGRIVVNITAAIGLAAVVTQPNPDLLRCDANLQVGDVDVGQANPVPARGNAATPVIYNVVMVNANTEYSQALPNGTQRLCLQCQSNYDVRFAFVTGRVAAPTPPYGIVRAGMNYYEDQLFLTANTLYVACGTAAQVAEIVVWS